MLTISQWAVILSIKCQPDYRFLGNEKAIAQRMVNRGWLRWNPRKDSVSQCYITAAGERAYEDYKKIHGMLSCAKAYAAASTEEPC